MLSSRATRKKVYRDLDCLCSSLAINCFQLSCCIPDVPQIEFPCKSLTNTWMAQLIECQPQLKLRDLVIPASHDSGSYSLQATTPFSASGRTQNVSIYEQLLLGARFLDLRVAGAGQENASDVYIFHGCLQCTKLETVLEEIKSFMEQHPQEFIFVEVVAEYGRLYTDEQKLHTLELLTATFGESIYNGKLGYQNLMNKWTLAQVVTGQKKNMCVMVHPRMYKFEVNDKIYLEETILDDFGFVNSHRWQRSHWHNTRDLNQLQEWNLEEVRKYGTQQNKMLTNQIILTPGVGGVLDVVKLLLGGNSLRPVSFATALYKSEVLDLYFRDHAEEPWNLIMLDYIDLTPALVCFLISLNFPPTLQILKADVIVVDANDNETTNEKSEVDITDLVKSHVKRNRVLYLTDIQNDLKLDRERGTLKIAYKMEKNGQDNCFVLEVEFDPETEVLLSAFCRNQENSVHYSIRPEDYPQVVK